MSLAIIGLIIILTVSATTIYAGLVFAPWVPTRRKDLKRIARLTGLKPDKTFYDLGAGDGRVARSVSTQTGCKSLALEISPLFFLITLLLTKISGNHKVKAIWHDFLRYKLTDADAVYLFAANSAKISGKIKFKLEQELKPGAMIISYCFPITGWRPDLIDKPNSNDLPIYVYQRT